MRRSSSCAHAVLLLVRRLEHPQYEPDTLWLVLRLRLWWGRRRDRRAEAAHAEAGARGGDDLVGSLFVGGARRAAARRAPAPPGAPSTSIGELRPAADSIGASARASKVTLC